MTPTVLKTSVMTIVRGLSGPFTFADVAAALAVEHGPACPEERRVRRAIDALKRTGVVTVTARGVMTSSEGIAGPGVEMAKQVDQFLRDNGGLMRACEYGQRHGGDDAGRRALHRALGQGLEAGRLEWLPVMPDNNAWWGLPEAERLSLPVPGWRITPDLALESQKNGGRLYQSIGDVNARRRAIGLAIRDARDAADLDVDAVLEAVGPAFMTNLYAGRASVLEQTIVSVGAYWRDVAAPDEAKAARRAWLELEDETHIGSAWPGTTIDVTTWRALGGVLGRDPAALSRGRLQ